MKRNRLAICDSEQEYAYRLMDALSQRADFPFEILTFTSAETLYESLRERPVQVLLIARSDFREEMKDWPASKIILLWEQEEPFTAGMAGIGKYSGVSRIQKKIMETAAENGNLPPPVRTDHPIQFWGMYTPLHRCLQTTLAFVTGQILARNHKVLYLNLECYSGLEQILSRSFEADFSELLYHLTETPEEILKHLCRMTENVNGMDVAPPAFSGFDILKMNQHEWMRLLEALGESRYEYVILDLSDGVQGIFEILRRCSRIFTIIREDAFSAAKLTQYEELLRKTDYEDVLQKTKKCMLPAFTKLPRDLNHLDGCEMTRFAEKMLQAQEAGEV